MSLNRRATMWSSLLLIGLLILPAAARATDLPLDEDFEGDTSGWTATGLWHKTASSPCPSPSPGYASPIHAFYYGQDATCNYNTGFANSGTVTSPPIGGIISSSTLTFQHFRRVEIPFDPEDETKMIRRADITRVEIVTSAGATQVFSMSSRSPAINAWVASGEISLAAFVGEEIQVRFVFDTVDAFNNLNTGWLIDDVKVTGSTDPPAPLVEGAGARYLAVTPGLWHEDVALSVQGFLCTPPGFGLPEPCGEDCPLVDCYFGFVQADGSVGPNPFFQSDEDWGTVYVRDAGIIPDAVYTARAQGLTTGWGPAVFLGKTYKWGDTNNDCIVDQEDIDCGVAGFQGAFTETCTPYSADLRATLDACDAPEGVINIMDILAIVDASQGVPFSCPGPCGPGIESVSPGTQRVHELVTLEGLEFGAFEPGVSKVLFSDGTTSIEAGTPYVWRDDFIQVRVPSGGLVGGVPTPIPTGNLGVKVVTAAGTSNSFLFKVRTASGSLAFQELTQIVSNTDVSAALGSPNFNMTRTKDGEVGDVDGDGWPDLVDNTSVNIRNQTHGVVRFNNGDKTFSAFELEPTGANDTGTYLTTVPVGGTYIEDATTYDSDLVDLNNDGLPELVEALRDHGASGSPCPSNATTQLVRVLVNNNGGPGSFLEDSLTWFGSSTFPGYADDVDHTDVDHNGFVDIGVAYRFSGFSDIFLNQQGSSFAPGIRLTGSGSMHDIFFLDADADRFSDVIVVNESGNSLLFFNDGAGGFGSPVTISFSSARAGIGADFNGDGLDDFALVRSGLATVFLNSPAAPGTFPTTVSLPNPQPVLYDIEAGDVDLDGAVDLIGAAIYPTGPVRVWLNNGAGTAFTDATPGLLPNLGAYQRLSADLIDLDLDGDLDLYITGADGQDVGPPTGCSPGPFGRAPNQLYENLLIP